MKSYLLLFLLLVHITLWGKSTSPVETVSLFGENLGSWCNTKNTELYSYELKKLCTESFRISDDIVRDWIKEKKMQELKHYDFKDYELCLTDIIRDGAKISISDVKLEQNVVYERPSKNDELFYYVSCQIKVTGEKNYNFKEMFYIRKGDNYRVTRIESCKERVNDKTGKKEVVVNTSDIMDWDGILTGDYNSIEVSYGYSEHFPLNIGLSANISYFNIGVEFGKSFTDTPLYFKNHTNFATSTIDGGYYYFMITPGIFLRYATIDCGLGSLISTYKYESVYSSYNENKSFFMVKPKATLNIPIPINFSSKHEIGYLCPHIGYQYVPDFPDLNCWEIGLGVRFRFNTY